MKLGILSNVNMDPIASYIQPLFGDAPYCAGYNQYLTELLTDTSAIYDATVQGIWIHLDGDTFIADQQYQFPDEAAITSWVDTLCQAVEQFVRKRPDVPVIISSLTFSPFHFSSFIRRNGTYPFAALARMINTRLDAFSAAYRTVVILDCERLMQLHGYRSLVDETFWYLGRIRYNNTGLTTLADEVLCVWNAYHGKTKKVLVVDLDNTLWGGVVGEDGVQGVRLSEEGEGKAYRDFQKAMYALKSLGVIFAINSKNNEADVQELFEKNPMMVFRYDDFVVKKINWNDKASNMIAIAEELNLGLDSFVFIDDNHGERAYIRQQLPAVVVPEFPQEPVMLRQWFLTDVVYRYFGKYTLTDEDTTKSEQYQRHVQRNTVQGTMSSNDFIQTLGIHLTIVKNDPSVAPRIAQLTQKTNQFTMTTRRYTEQDIAQYMQQPECFVYGLYYEDTFGKEGLMGAAIVHTDKTTATIDTFLLSCRIIGRHVEHTFLDGILKELQTLGIQNIKAEFLSTTKNIIAKDFYPSCSLTSEYGAVYEGSSAQCRSALSPFCIHGALHEPK